MRCGLPVVERSADALRACLDSALPFSECIPAADWVVRIGAVRMAGGVLRSQHQYKRCAVSLLQVTLERQRRAAVEDELKALQANERSPAAARQARAG